MRTGDTVKHRPTGETWTVAYVDGDRLAPCGWPNCEALVSDCDLIEACSDEEHRDILDRCAEIREPHDKRGRMARRALGRAA